VGRAWAGPNFYQARPGPYFENFFFTKPGLGSKIFFGFGFFLDKPGPARPGPFRTLHIRTLV